MLNSLTIITLTTDFGTSDAYVGAMKGVILSINPKANIIDICHSIEPQNVLQAAFVLSTAYPYFPKGTIHMVIVDPGVGSKRKAVIVKTASAFFLAPDNGVLSYVIEEMCPSQDSSPTTASGLRQRELTGGVEAISITNPRFWLQPVSTTFHGRDVFAPVAAHLSLGISPYEFGEGIPSLHVLPIPRPYYDTQGNLIGHILHIDHFGNLITNIKSLSLPTREIVIEISEQHIHGLSDFYAQTSGLIALIGSSDYLEISLSNGSAGAFLGVDVGDKIKVRLV